MSEQQEGKFLKQKKIEKLKKQRSKLKFRKLKKKSQQQNPAETKNLLVNMRNYHVQFAERMGKKDHILIKKFKEAKTVNTRAYQQLYSDQQLRPVYRIYFKTKQIYRDLNRSRINIENKIKYLKFLDAFEQAYNHKKFDLIVK